MTVWIFSNTSVAKMRFLIFSFVNRFQFPTKIQQANVFREEFWLVAKIFVYTGMRLQTIVRF